MIVFPGKRNRLYKNSGAKEVSVYCFTGLSNERLKSNVLPFGGIFCLHFFLNKMNLIKFAFYRFHTKIKNTLK